ncbi:MAG: hypothetical protein ACXW3Z_02535 [Limisphaerales bacterium]
MQPFGLQEWIHKLEEGDGAKFIRLGLFFLALLALAALWHIREATNFSSMDAMDSAQLARNIADGKGYTTQFVRAFSIALIEQHQGRTNPELLTKPHPDLANPPVYPVLLAGLLKLMPVNWEITEQFFWRYQPEWFIGGFNQLLFFIVLFFVYRISARLFDRAVGALAVVLMALTEIYWQFTTSGLSTMLLIALCLWLVDVLISIEMGSRAEVADAPERAPDAAPSRSKGWLLGMAAYAGVIVGLMALTRYSMGWLIVPVAVFLGVVVARARGAAAAVSVAVFVLCLAPWLARNYSISGTLFGTAGYAIHQGTSAFPGHVLGRSMPTDVGLAMNKVEVAQYPRKLFVNGRDILTDELPRVAGNWISALFLGSMLIPFRSVTLRRLKVFLGCTLLLFLVVQALGRTALSTDAPQINSENLLFVFTPMFFVFGCGFFFVLLDQIVFPAQWMRSLAMAGFVALLSLPMLFRLLPPRALPFDYPPYYPPYIQRVSNWMEPQELMMSDMPWAVAWYGNRQCIWTTLDVGENARDDFYRINDEYKALHGLYLTPITTNQRFLTEMRQGREGSWAKFYLDVAVMKNLPTGFPMKMAPPGMLPDQLFLSDRIRWR